MSLIDLNDIFPMKSSEFQKFPIPSKVMLKKLPIMREISTILQEHNLKTIKKFQVFVKISRSYLELFRRYEQLNSVSVGQTSSSQVSYVKDKKNDKILLKKT